MKDIIEAQNQKLKQSLIDEFINNHDKLKHEIVKTGMTSTGRYYLKFNFKINGFPKNKTLFYIILDENIRGDEYEFFSNTGYYYYNIKLKSAIKDVLNNSEFELDKYRPLVQNGFPTDFDYYGYGKGYGKENVLRKILIGYVNDYIKVVYSKKLNEVNAKFLETQKTLLKIKDKIQTQKQKDPIDIQKYERTFEEFQSNLKEFEGFLNIIKTK